MMIMHKYLICFTIYMTTKYKTFVHTVLNSNVHIILMNYILLFTLKLDIITTD